MGMESIETPALLGIILALGLGYVVGFEIGLVATGSLIVAVLTAFVMPIVGVLAITLLVVRARASGTMRDN